MALSLQDQIKLNRGLPLTGVLETCYPHGKNRCGADLEQYENGKTKNPVFKTSKCEAVPLGAIQLKIQNLIKEIERIEKSASDWETKISTKLDNIRNTILGPFSPDANADAETLKKIWKERNIEEAATFIAGGIKWLIEQIQKFTTNTINNALKDTYYLIFPNQRPGFKSAVETVNDLLACLFRKIIANLLGMIGDFLFQMIDRYINAPLCAVENFIASLLGQITGLISSVIDSILGPISSLVGQAFDIAGDILGFIKDLLSFLSCDEDPSCAEITEWSTWNGSASPVTLDLNSLFTKIENVASTITDAIDPNNFDFDFNLDFSGLWDSAASSCNVGSIFCGPPIVEFYGGGGSGSLGNAIVSATGDILGVDIIAPGSGYSSAPFVTFVDDCGNGSGGTGTAVIGPNDDGTYGVVEVIIENPGYGYIPSPDGSQGGSGRTWAGSGDTIVKREDGTYDRPYNPGDIINLNPGDTVQSCGGVPYTITETTTITAPQCNFSGGGTGTGGAGGNFTNIDGNPTPTLNNGEYPVNLEIDKVVVTNRGFNYNENDTIVVNPDNGSVLSPIFDQGGSLVGVDVINSGEGFTEFPEILVQSNTGFNARMIPVFKVKRVKPGDEKVSPDKIIKVVDCVGKV